MTLVLLWISLAGAAAIILVSAHFMARSADVIGFKTGLGRTFAGVVLLATATSLPELGTGVSSIVWFDEPDLAVGDAFGSNLFNLLIIGVLDLIWRNGPVLNSVSMTTVVVGATGIVIISVAAFGLVFHTLVPSMSGMYISPISIIMFVIFLGGMFIIYKMEQGRDSDDDDEADYSDDSMVKSALIYLLSAAIVVAAAVLLAGTGDRIADAMGWEASFVGTQFLALSTSLPELAASVAAIRLNAPELAISNVLGSNMFNMGFILFMDELAYTSGTLWSIVASIHSLTAITAILMTALVIVAITFRPRGRPVRFITYEGGALIAMYVVISVVVFKVG